MWQFTNRLFSRRRGPAPAPATPHRARPSACRLEVESLETRWQVSALLSAELSPFADVLATAAVTSSTVWPDSDTSALRSLEGASLSLSQEANADPVQMESVASAALSDGSARAIPLHRPADAPGSLPNWSVQVGTAPGIPQDIWITAHGNNTEGWQGAGSIALVGPLSEGGVDVRTVAVLDSVEQGGIIGVDGTPVAPGTYTAPGITEPTIQFNVVAGQTFYLVFNDHIVNTDVPGLYVGEQFHAMFTFNTVLGHTAQNLVNWIDFGQGLQPFLNEGTMMTNIHHQP
jgi:hypothetical protein